MSTQNLSELSRERYAEETEEKLLQMADAYFYQKHFLLGKTPDRDRIRHAMIFSNILCRQHCEILNYIQDKITGKLEFCGKKPKSKKLNSLINQCETELEISCEDIIECTSCNGNTGW